MKWELMRQLGPCNIRCPFCGEKMGVSMPSVYPERLAVKHSCITDLRDNAVIWSFTGASARTRRGAIMKARNGLRRMFSGKEF